jgi:hypothetical protein
VRMKDILQQFVARQHVSETSPAVAPTRPVCGRVGVVHCYGTTEMQPKLKGVSHFVFNAHCQRGTMDGVSAARFQFALAIREFCCPIL